MESNFKELKMKLTKVALIKEYSTAISTIESKDRNISELRGLLSDARAELAELRAIAKKSSSDAVEQLRADNIAIRAVNKEVTAALTELLDGFELTLKLNQTANDTAVHLYSTAKANIMKKWGAE
jgi:hypothetical protein